MGAIVNFSIKNADGIYENYTASISDNVDKYGNNVSITLPQTKEQRIAKEKKTFVGNGKVVWTDNKIDVAPKQEFNPKSNYPTNNSKPMVTSDDSDLGLPF